MDFFTRQLIGRFSLHVAAGDHFKKSTGWHYHLLNTSNNETNTSYCFYVAMTTEKHPSKQSHLPSCDNFLCSGQMMSPTPESGNLLLLPLECFLSGIVPFT